MLLNILQYTGQPPPCNENFPPAKVNTVEVGKPWGTVSVAPLTSLEASVSACVEQKSQVVSAIKNEIMHKKVLSSFSHKVVKHASAFD